MKVFRQTIFLLLAFAVIIGIYLLYIKPSEERKKEKEEALKKLVDVSSNDVVEIWVERAGEKIAFSRRGKGWDIIHPVWAEADKFSVNPIASRFSSIEIERVIEESPSDLTGFGLAQPRFTVRLFVKGKSEPIVLHIGEKSRVGYNVYAMREGDGRVVLVSAALESVINKKIDEFREKRPMDFAVPDVRKVKIERDGKLYFFRKKDGDEWEIDFPDTTTYVKADETQVRNLLYSISGLKIKDFVSDVSDPTNLYGLDNPNLKIAVWLVGDQEEVGEREGVGEQGDGEGIGEGGLMEKGDVSSMGEEEVYPPYSLFIKFEKDGVYGKRPGRPNIFTFEIDKNSESLRSALTADAFREKRVMRFYVWRVKEIAVERPYKSTIIRRDELNTEKWYLVTGGDKGTELISSKVKEALERLSEVQVLKFLADNVYDISRYIENPGVRVRVNIEGKTDPYYLILGGVKNIDGFSGVIGALENEKGVYLFPSNITDVIQGIEDLAFTARVTSPTTP